MPSSDRLAVGVKVARNTTASSLAPAARSRKRKTFSPGSSRTFGGEPGSSTCGPSSISTAPASPWPARTTSSRPSTTRFGTALRTVTRIGSRWPPAAAGGASTACTSTSDSLRKLGARAMASICTWFCLASAACSSAPPRFSLPSDSRTIRLAVLSGNDASASLIAAAMFV